MTNAIIFYIFYIFYISYIFYWRKLEAKQGSMSPDLTMNLALFVTSYCLMSLNLNCQYINTSVAFFTNTAASAARLMEFMPGNSSV